MQLTVIEKEVLDNMHDLPLDKQQSILDFSLFIKSIVANPIQNTKPLKRQAGLGKGSTWMSEDFNEPLPDGFWLGEE